MPGLKRALKIGALSGARLLGAFAIARFATRHHVRIMCYHAGTVGDESRYNPKLFCSAELIRERMQWLTRRGFNFVSLDQALNTLDAKAPLRKLQTAVTFDDGWFTTADKLVPALSGLGIPSTLYVTTEEYGRGWPVLGVTIRYALWKSGQQRLAISDNPAFAGEYDLASTSELNTLVDKVVAWIKQSATTRAEACACLESFATSVGVPGESLLLATRRFDFVTAEEMRDLQAQGCKVELHGHAHRYPLGDARGFQSDLQTCHSILTDAGLAGLAHYCYPGGSFDTIAEHVLARMGVRSATTCKPGLVTSATSRFYLPRFLDGGSVHQLEFEAEMSGVFHLLRGVLAWREWKLFGPSAQRPLWDADLGTASALGNSAGGSATADLWG